MTRLCTEWAFGTRKRLSSSVALSTAPGTVLPERLWPNHFFPCATQFVHAGDRVRVSIRAGFALASDWSWEVEVSLENPPRHRFAAVRMSYGRKKASLPGRMRSSIFRPRKTCPAKKKQIPFQNE